MAPKLGSLKYKKKIQIYKIYRFHSCRLCLLENILDFGSVLLDVKFWLLAINFICTHLHDGAISVCLHALIGLETLRVWV